MTLLLAGYDRQSQARDSGSEASPTTQRTANEESAAKLRQRGEDVHFVGHFSEKPGTSAFSGVDRPRFNALLDECRAGRVNVVAVYNVSRFSRLDPLDAIPVVTELLNLGVLIISAKEGEFRKGNLMDLIHIIMRLHAAYEESRMKSESIRDTNAQAVRLGGVTGKAPYGFRFEPRTVLNTDGRPIVIRVLAQLPQECDVIRHMWRTIKAHMDEPYATGGYGNRHPGSLTGLVWAMNQPGETYVPTRGATTAKRAANSGWSTAGVKRILSDPIIAGFQRDVVYKTNARGEQTRGVEGYRIRRDNVTMKPLTIEAGPILDPAEWYELQAWLKTRKRGSGLNRGTAYLSGMDMLKCECGNPMVGAGGSGAAENNDSYRCTRRKVEPGTHSGYCTILQRTLHSYVGGRIMALIGTAEDDEATLSTLAAATARYAQTVESPRTAEERRSLVAARSDAASALEELYDDRQAGGYGGAIGRRKFLEAEAKLSFTISGAEERLAEIEAAAVPRLPIGEWLPDDADADPVGPGSWWAGASNEKRRELVRLFVKRITVFKAHTRGRGSEPHERVRIEWHTAEGDEAEAGV